MTILASRTVTATPYPLHYVNEDADTHGFVTSQLTTFICLCLQGQMFTSILTLTLCCPMSRSVRLEKMFYCVLRQYLSVNEKQKLLSLRSKLARHALCFVMINYSPQLFFFSTDILIYSFVIHCKSSSLAESTRIAYL